MIDRQATVDGETAYARLRSGSIRRVINARAVMSLIQECSSGLRNPNGRVPEGDLAKVDGSWTMVALYTDDVLASPAYWWNTGNPRYLVDRYVRPIDLAGSGASAGVPLWDSLAERFERCTHPAPRAPARWFRAPWQDLRDAINDYIAQGLPLEGGDAWCRPSKDGRSMVYLMVESEGSDETGWVKVGMCAANKTSPPDRRLTMYQPGNRRLISVGGAWVVDGKPKSVEDALKSELNAYCKANLTPCRSEWYQVGMSKALAIIAPVLLRSHATPL